MSNKRLRPSVLGLVRSLIQDCRGSLLLEALVASAVFALVGTAVLAGLGTANIAGSNTETQSVAENIARNQMEFIFTQPYREPDQTPYPGISVPASYSVAPVATHLSGNSDPEIENIALTVSRNGQSILELDTVRVRNDGLRLLYSVSSDRSNPAQLHNAIISGTVYVFLDDPNVLIDNQVDFFLDGGSVRQTEAFVHWDFEGSDGLSPTDPANPWDTTSDATATNGAHIITARAVLADGNAVNVTADFTIDN